MKEYFQTRLFKVQVGKRVSLIANGETYVKIGPNSLQAGPNGTITRVPIITPVILEKDQYWHWPPPEPLYGDDGFDPILGPPYPPTNYQMLVHDGRLKNGVQDFLQPRLTWTAPDVMIEADFAQSGIGIFWSITATVTNYEWPEWDNGTQYIQNQRVQHLGVAYYSDIAGINQGIEPPGAGEWAEDNTRFQLYVFGGINDDTGEIYYPDWTLVNFVDAPDTELFYALALEAPPIRAKSVLNFYIKATGDLPGTVYSPTVAFTWHP